MASIYCFPDPLGDPRNQIDDELHQINLLREEKRKLEHLKDVLLHMLALEELDQQRFAEENQ